MLPSQSICSRTMSNPNLPLSASPVGIMSPSDNKPMASTSVAERRSCIFWDVGDFPIPNGADPLSIYQRMKTFLEGKGSDIGEFSIILYVDDKEMMRYDAFKEATGFTILSREGDDYPRGDFMLVDIVLWAMKNPATYFEPLNLMVISKNIKEETDFLNALEALEDRYYNVLLALPQHLSPSIKLLTVSFQWLLSSLLGVVEPDQSGTFHHLPNSRDETVGFSDGLASVDEHWNMSDIKIFCDLGCSTDFKCIRSKLVGKGYVSPYMIIRTYTSSRVDHVPLELEGDYWCEETIVDEDAKVTRMLLDVLFWAMNSHDVRKVLMIISKQCTNWDRVIEVLEGSGFIVIFGPSAEVTSLSLDTIKIFEDVTCLQSEPLVKHGRKMITGRRFARNYVVAFWLVEDFPSNPNLLMHCVTQTLEEKGYGNLISLTVYVYKPKILDPKILDDVEHAYCNGGVRVELLPDENELERTTMLFVNMIESSISLSGTANFLVISEPIKSDAMWTRAIELLRIRGCNVLCELPDYMCTFGSSLWSAKDLLAGSSPLSLFM